MSKSLQDTELGKGHFQEGTAPDIKDVIKVVIPEVSGGAPSDAFPATAIFAQAGEVVGQRYNDGVLEHADPATGSWAPIAPASSGGSATGEILAIGGSITEHASILKDATGAPTVIKFTDAYFASLIAQLGTGYFKSTNIQGDIARIWIRSDGAAEAHFNYALNRMLKVSATSWEAVAGTLTATSGTQSLAVNVTYTRLY